MKLSDIAVQTKSQLIFPSAPIEVTIRGLTTLALAQSGDLTFITNFQYRDEVATTKASAILTAKAIPGCHLPQLIHANPYAVLAQLGQQLHPVTHSFTGQSPLAFVDPTASVAASATLYPQAYVGPRASIGEHAVLYPFSYVGADAHVGEGSVLYPSSTVMERCKIGARCILHAGAVIGGDGFGFAPTKDDLLKIPQMGTVILEDEVEVGASSTIDRATYGATTLCHGVKVDSQVQVGHNATVGAYTMLCAQVGIAGSAKIGSRCIAAGQSGVGHGISIGDGTILGPKAGAVQSIIEPGEYMGMPPIAAKQWMKLQFSLKKVPDLIKKIAQLEAQLEKLQAGT